MTKNGLQRIAKKITDKTKTKNIYFQIINTQTYFTTQI